MVNHTSLTQSIQSHSLQLEVQSSLPSPLCRPLDALAQPTATAAPHKATDPSENAFDLLRVNSDSLSNGIDEID
jgi:hypothetical protein